MVRCEAPEQQRANRCMSRVLWVVCSFPPRCALLTEYSTSARRPPLIPASPARESRRMALSQGQQVISVADMSAWPATQDEQKPTSSLFSLVDLPGQLRGPRRNMYEVVCNVERRARGLGVCEHTRRMGQQPTTNLCHWQEL